MQICKLGESKFFYEMFKLFCKKLDNIFILRYICSQYYILQKTPASFSDAALLAKLMILSVLTVCRVAKSFP